MHRRAFLRGIGGVVLALPFLESIEMRGVRAGTPPPVSKRFICFFQCNGVNMDKFFPTGGFGPLTAASFGAGTALAPLAPYASRLLIPRGLHTEPKGYMQSPVTMGCDHQVGMAHKLTAQPKSSADVTGYPTGISVDQEMAKSLNPAGVSALTASVGTQGSDDLGIISYSGPNAPVKGQNNPKLLLDSLGLATADTKTQAMVNARRQSVLDLVSTDLAALKRKGLSAADQQKLDMHLTNLRAAENGASGLSCTIAPELASATGAINPKTVGDDANFKALGQLTMDILTLAVACNRSNVASILWGRGSGGPVFKWDGMNFAFNHHAISHGGSGSGLGSPIAGFMDMLFQIDTWHATQMKYLLDKLDAYKEGANSVLDNSAVLWINELSDGDYHQYHDLPVVIAGGAGGALKTGQYVNLTKSAPAPSTDSNGNFKGNMILGDDSAGHNLLLTTLLNACGAKNNGQPYTHFGHSSLADGQYAQLLV